MTGHTQIRVDRAIEAQRGAMAVAAALGDVAEENARLRALERLQRRTAASSRSDADFLALILRMQRDANQRGRVSWLGKLALNPRHGIGDIHLRTADILREHIEGAISASFELAERVDGGSIHNSQMEGLVDRRRPLRYALDKAVDAISDHRIARPAMMVIIHDCSPRAACVRFGIPWAGRMQPRIAEAVVEALDAAAAHIGVAR